MRRRTAGFTLVEMLITMAIIGFVLAGASQMFVTLLGSFKQQGKVAETNIEGIIGLELLRQDLDSAGYGLPWVIPTGVTYQEAAAGYNDSGTPSNPPRAFLSGNNIGLYANGGTDGSDILVIKAVNIARNEPCKKWTYLSVGDVLHNWSASSETLSATDQVIVLDPGATNATRRTLVVNGSNWRTTYNNTSNYAPDASTVRFVYGIEGPTPTIRMPFNRADYYITSSYVPQRCAPNTGVLVKSVISHSDGSRSDQMPLIDCVADMQVRFSMTPAIDPNGTSTAYYDDITTLSAQDIRDRLRWVTVYILAHEGQKDSNYVHNQTSITVGAHSVDVSTRLNYRWKLYTLSVRPHNLR